MVERRGEKRTYISISSSSEYDEDDQGEEESDSESESRSESVDCDVNDDDEFEETSASTSCDDGGVGKDDDDESESDWSDDQVDESDDHEHEESTDFGNDESLCKLVTRLLREKSDLQELNINDCKSYLRRHGLRITGTKAECIQRIMEHWRIKDRNAEALYPRSSFAINCTGDVCRGDVVLFTQKVNKKFDKVTRTGNFSGKRTVAGRVVKESYGAAKQQHTFTIEVLWTMGVKKLPPLFPLLVKGRNLYKLKTFRQCWTNEAERLKVLSEKHKRGAAARLVREMRIAKKTCSKNGGVKRQKTICPSQSSRRGKKAELGKGRNVDGCGKVPTVHAKSSNHHQQKAAPVGRANLKKNSKARAKSSRKQKNLIHPTKNGDPTARSNACPPQYAHPYQMQFRPHQQWSAPLHFPYYGAGSASCTRYPQSRPYVDSSVMPVPQLQGLDHGVYPHYGYPSHLVEPRNLNRSTALTKIYRPSEPFHFGKEAYGQRRREF